MQSKILSWVNSRGKEKVITPGTILQERNLHLYEILKKKISYFISVFIFYSKGSNQIFYDTKGRTIVCETERLKLLRAPVQPPHVYRVLTLAGGRSSAGPWVQE